MTYREGDAYRTIARLDKGSPVYETTKIKWIVIDTLGRQLRLGLENDQYIDLVPAGADGK